MLSEPVVGRPCMLMRVVMSLNMGVSIGPFDPAFSFQEETRTPSLETTDLQTSNALHCNVFLHLL